MLGQGLPSRMLRFHGQNQQPGADEMPVLRMPLAPGPQPPTPPPLGLRHEGCGGHRGAAERHLLGMTASVGGKGSGRKTNRRRGRQEVGHRCGRQEAVSGGGQAGGWLSWGVAPGYPMAPGQSRAPRLFQLHLEGKLDRENVPGRMPSPTSPYLGSDNTAGGLAKARTQASAPPFSPPLNSQAVGLPPPALSILSFR